MVPIEIKAMVIAIFFCSITLSATVASLVVGALITKSNNIGFLIALNTALPAIIASVFFYCAGKPYENFLKEKNSEVEMAFSKASCTGNRKMSMQSSSSAEASFDFEE